MQQTIFDIWDLLLSEMEDTIVEGFRGHRQLPYAQWITFLIHKAVTVRPPEMLAEYSGATIEFPTYNMTQMICHSVVRTPSQLHHRPEVLETAAQQDETIRGIEAIEEEQLDAQQEGMVESDPSDSSDDDYRDIPQMPPRQHDHEASTSSLAPPAPQIDPALLSILERMRQDQAHQA